MYYGICNTASELMFSSESRPNLISGLPLDKSFEESRISFVKLSSVVRKIIFCEKEMEKIQTIK